MSSSADKATFPQWLVDMAAHGFDQQQVCRLPAGGVNSDGDSLGVEKPILKNYRPISASEF